MSRGPTTFRQRDMAAAIKAARAAGCEVARIEVDKTGKIVVILRNGKECSAEHESSWGNEWDAILE
jgi:hypothetical protein